MNKIVFKKGESVTIGFLLNSEYDMGRIQSASAWVGGKKFALATIDHMLRCELASDETHKLSGNYKLILWIDDSTLGVKKTYAADIEISTNNSNDNNDSTNEGYDFVFNITINETAIQAGDILYNYVKGDNADLPDGIVIDPNYVHTDNNYDDAAVEEVAKVAWKQDKTDNSLATDDKTVVGAINEVNSVAKGANQALAFDNYQAVIAAMLISGLNEGQNLYVDTLEVPDLWVKSVELTSVSYTYSTDEQFITDILAGIQIGYYKLALLETQKVDLTNYYNKIEVDNLLDDKSDVGHNHSGETINPEAIDFGLTPTTAPNVQGRMQYSPTERTIEFGVEGGTIDVNKELFDYYVYTDNNLVEGNVVSVTGISGNRQAVTKTNNTQRASATACIGMVTHKNADNTVRVTKKGRVRKLNTGGMTEGLPVYANATGGFTQTEPTAGDYFIHVGIVEVAHAVNGVIDVDIRIVYDVEDLSNVDGAATTVASGDSFFIKVGNLWKTITESNFLSWFRGLSHTFTQLITFSGNLKTTKIIPNSDTTGVVIRNAADSAGVVKVDTANNRVCVGGSNPQSNIHIVAAVPQIRLSQADGANGANSFVFGYSSADNQFMIGAKPGDSNMIALSGGDLNFGTVDIGNTNQLLRFSVLKSGSTNLVAGKYEYHAASKLADTVNDTRSCNSSGVVIYERCTVANATKGSGTWVEIFRIDANGFQSAQYDDILPSSEWAPASGGTAPDTATHTIGGMAANYKAFDGGTTEESMVSSFEILHAVDVASLNAETLKMEIHTHGMPATTGSGDVKIFYDLVYQPVNAAPIAWGTYSNIITISANQQYYHKLGGVELTKPSSGYQIGDQIIVKYRRTPSDAQDTYAGDWLFMQCAMHAPMNSNGSRQRYVK